MGLEKRLVVYGRPREGADLPLPLRERGFQVYAVESEDELLDVVQYSQPDAVVVAGRTNGPALAKLVSVNQNNSRSVVAVVWPGIPVNNAVELLEAGVDYVVGSYQPDWLASQLRAILRRVGRERSVPSVISLGSLHIDLQQRKVTVEDREVPLTPTEFSVLRVLAERPGTVLPSGEIMQQVMGVQISQAEAQDILKVHIHRLRQKLELESPQRELIRTVRGHGYMYAFERRSRERTAEATPEPSH